MRSNRIEDPCVLRAAATSAAVPQDVLAFVLARLSCPRELDMLATEIRRRAQSGDLGLECNHLLQGIWKTAAEAFRALQRTHDLRYETGGRGAQAVSCGADSAACAATGDAGMQLDCLIRQLPRMHAAVLLAHKRERVSGEALAQRFSVSDFVVEKYLSQARALIRTFAASSVSVRDGRMILMNRNELLVAQEAAEWLSLLVCGALPNRLEFLHWLRSCDLHARELLIAAGWDALLDRSYSTACTSSSLAREG